MNKIIAAFDGLKIAESTKKYAIEITKIDKSHLTGVFLDDKTYTSYKIYDLVLEEGVSQKKLLDLKSKDNYLRANAAQEFEKECNSSNISYNIHHDKNVAIQELIHETIFSDLLIINNKEAFNHYEEKNPSRFLRDLLSNTQCAVLLTPEKYREIKKLIFLFDGKPTSVFAIKMFNYLFSHFSDFPFEVICVKTMEEDLHLPENKLIKELINRHYQNVKYTVLKGIPEVEISQYLVKEIESCVIILGAYRRTMVSRWFKSSLADELIKKFQFPLFIAHNK